MKSTVGIRDQFLICLKRWKLKIAVKVTKMTKNQVRYVYILLIGREY